MLTLPPLSCEHPSLCFQLEGNLRFTLLKGTLMKRCDSKAFALGAAR